MVTVDEDVGVVDVVEGRVVDVELASGLEVQATVNRVRTTTRTNADRHEVITSSLCLRLMEMTLQQDGDAKPVPGLADLVGS